MEIDEYKYFSNIDYINIKLRQQLDGFCCLINMLTDGKLDMKHFRPPRAFLKSRATFNFGATYSKIYELLNYNIKGTEISDMCYF